MFRDYFRISVAVTNPMPVLAPVMMIVLPFKGFLSNLTCDPLPMPRWPIMLFHHAISMLRFVLFPVLLSFVRSLAGKHFPPQELGAPEEHWPMKRNAVHNELIFKALMSISEAWQAMVGTSFKTACSDCAQSSTSTFRLGEGDP